MGHSQDEKTRSRQRILDVASRRFRERGLEGLSIADVMKEAGLTHGGFYKHFGSREDLVAAAVNEAMTETVERPALDLETFVSRYLSPEHRDAPGGGCALSALAADVARADGRSRAVFTDQLRRGLERLSELSREAGEGGGAQDAMARMSALMGALILARAVDDPALSEALMAATRENVQPRPAAAMPGERRASPGAPS